MAISPDANTRDGATIRARRGEPVPPRTAAIDLPRSPATVPSAAARSFDGLTVFSATTSYRRDVLGNDITEWLRRHPELTPVETVVQLSSDKRFHCMSIVIFWRRDAGGGHR
jgi:hypothetical protein